MASTKPIPKLRQRLARPIRDVAGAELRTRQDAAEYIAALPDDRGDRNSWRHAITLLQEGADAEALTKQIELAMLLELRLDARFTQEQMR